MDIIDLRVGNCVSLHKNGRFKHGFITSISEDSVKLKSVSDDKVYSSDLENIHALKVTKRWLRDNEFNEPEEIVEEEEVRYTHQSLPIVYCHNNHKLFIFGRIFPTKVVYIHHLQNVILDCGIDFATDFKESHATQIEPQPITFYLGSMKKPKEFFDTNTAFGLSGMPKFDLGGPRMAVSMRYGNNPNNEGYQRSFISILSILTEGVRVLADFFYNRVTLDQETRIVALGRVMPAPGGYVIKREGDPIHSNIVSLNDIIEFASNWGNIVRGNDYQLGLYFPREMGEDHRIAQRDIIEARINYYVSVTIKSRRSQEDNVVLTPESNVPGNYDLFFSEFGEIISAPIEMCDDILNHGPIARFVRTEVYNRRDFDRIVGGRPVLNEPVLEAAGEMVWGDDNDGREEELPDGEANFEAEVNGRQIEAAEAPREVDMDVRAVEDLANIIKKSTTRKKNKRK